MDALFAIALAAAQPKIALSPAYIDMVDGNLYDALMLSQIVYWFSPGEDGRTRARVEKEGKLWVAKKHSEWWNEIRINERTVRRSLDRLVARGLIEQKTFKFGGTPTTHIRINWPEFQELFMRVVSGPQGQVEVTSEDKSLTDITTEITSSSSSDEEESKPLRPWAVYESLLELEPTINRGQTLAEAKKMIAADFSLADIIGCAKHVLKDERRIDQGIPFNASYVRKLLPTYVKQVELRGRIPDGWVPLSTSHGAGSRNRISASSAQWTPLGGAA